MCTEIFIVDGYAFEVATTTLRNMHQHDAEDFYEEIWWQPHKAEPVNDFGSDF